MDGSNPLGIADQEVWVSVEHFLQHLRVGVAGCQVNHCELPAYEMKQAFKSAIQVHGEVQGAEPGPEDFFFFNQILKSNTK